MKDAAWADFRETHLSAVFMAGDYVVKFKKPVRTDFVDLSSLAARDDFCEAEVRLNSRLSPDVYVGVARIGLTDRGPGEPVVVMRRLHDRDQLAQRLLAHEPLASAALRAVAREIAAFHSRCDVDTSQDSPGSWASVRAAWLRECAELDQLAEGVTDASTRTLIRQLGLRYLDGRQALLAARVKSGQVREGHGDLRCEHVYLTSRGVRIIDCVEFDRSLRVADVISDVAFLVMDLERLGGTQPASALLEWYTEFSAEVAPRSLLDFYVAYRALVRAKVAAIRAEQDGRVSPDIGRYVALALTHLRAAIPVVVCIGGLPGSGKTSLSDAFARDTGAIHLSSDEIRHGLRPERDPASDSEAWETGSYSPAVTHDVYRALLDRASTALAEGSSVVLDASWREPGNRWLAREVARQSGAVAVELLCEVDEATAYRRLARSRGGYSQAGVRTRGCMTQAFAPWPEALPVRTDREVDASVSDVEQIVRAELSRELADAPVG